MNHVKRFYKNLGETPLEALDRFQLEFPEYKDEKLSYAGRLDPMAEGILLIMIGDANQERERYLGLDKEYEFEVLFGVQTDTYDILGLVQDVDEAAVSRDGIEDVINTFKGAIELPYPPYSSKTVEGKALFQWAREERLDEIDIPTREVEIYSFDVIGERVLKGEEILNEVLKKVDLVNGDFRQDEIKERWKEKLADKGDQRFSLVTRRVKCSSGTYMRTLAHELGKKMGVGAIAYSIKRIDIVM